MGYLLEVVASPMSFAAFRFEVLDKSLAFWPRAGLPSIWKRGKGRRMRVVRPAIGPARRRYLANGFSRCLK